MIEQEQTNRKNRRLILFGLLISLAIPLLSMLLTINKGLSWVDFVIGVPLAAFVFYFIAFHAEFILRPGYVTICREGILIEYRFPRNIRNRSEFLTWSNIESINVAIGDIHGDAIKKVDGRIWSGDGRFFLMDKNLAIQIRDAYREVVGEYPALFHKM